MGKKIFIPICNAAGQWFVTRLKEQGDQLTWKLPKRRRGEPKTLFHGQEWAIVAGPFDGEDQAWDVAEILELAQED